MYPEHVEQECFGDNIWQKLVYVCHGVRDRGTQTSGQRKKKKGGGGAKEREERATNGFAAWPGRPRAALSGRGERTES